MVALFTTMFLARAVLEAAQKSSTCKDYVTALAAQFHDV
jgi:hypothetical protein